ncbi:TonB-dependent receptor [Eikenella sp. S3360]|uniref:TonB-dependent receptor n=1 Tax=Eikenella glucosivorans TaxID=2766967 RepID=A0ABS0N836_9NEIS|nr:TonB-dependent receptor [Eikenella glucosivorans]MBH5328466.1 TonB-dependent receptor [Eikenella glucosivorans]
MFPRFPCNAILLGLLAVATPQAFADTSGQAEESAFELGQITVIGKRTRSTDAGEHTVSAEDIRRTNSQNIAQALETQAGVNIDFSGARNETGLRVRGFDARQVPLFLDGIPQYVPYDGYVDFARFLTPGLSEIRVAKSGASLMYGPNTMGGAINLVTRKPSKPFEGDINIGFDDTVGHNLSANFGSNTGRFYIQGGFAYLDSDRFHLPHHFRDPKRQPTDTGSYRENAARTDRHYSLKLGFTPNLTDEYAIGYSGIRSEKQQPAYVGTANQNARYWRWPYWDKDSFYFLSNIGLGEANRLKIRAYHDTYKNGLQMYRDAAYSIPDGEISAYKDRAQGLSINFSTAAWQNQLLQIGYQYKADRHHELSDNQVFRDAAHQIAAEHQIDFTPSWRLRSGLDYERLATKELPASFNSGKTSSVNGLLELSYRPNDNHTFYGTLSSKSRFPSLKDRYSYRLGRAIPNPDLESERANHVELGWRGKPWQGAEAEAAVFYSRLRNEIQNAYVPDPTGRTCRRSPVPGYCQQTQNIGRTRHAGFELGLRQNIGSQWTLGATYGYLHRKDLGDTDTPLLNTPRHKLSAYAEYRPIERVSLNASVLAETGRKSSYGNGTRTLGGYAVYNAKAAWRIREGLTWEAGVENLGNRYYELSDGYPMPGRTWFTNLRYAF